MSRKGADFERLARPIGNPADGQVPAFRASDGNLVWSDPGTEPGPVDPNGFIVNSSGFDVPGAGSETTISFNEASRTFSITPTSGSFSYTYQGVRYTRSTSSQLQIPDSEGLHYIWMEEDGQLFSSQTFDTTIITEKVFCAVVYWNATDNEALLFADERHGNQMDPRTHLYNHLTFGTRYQAPGFGLVNMDVDGNGDDASAAQFDVEAGTIWDEDIQHTIPPTASGIPIFYRSGATAWRRGTVVGFNTLTAGSGRMAYNLFSGGVWSLAELANSDFGLVHYFATGDVNDPIIGVLGQGDFPTLGQARGAAPDELVRLSFGALNDLSPEFAPIATVIYQTANGYSNAVKARVRSTDEGDDYIDWRGFIPVGGAAGAGGLGGSGVGLPVGGSDGSALVKQSATDYDAGWESPFAFKRNYIYQAITGTRTISGTGATIVPLVAGTGPSDSTWTFSDPGDSLTFAPTSTGRARFVANIPVQFNGTGKFRITLRLRKNAAIIATVIEDYVASDGLRVCIELNYVEEVTQGDVFTWDVSITGGTGHSFASGGWVYAEWLGVAP